jgi:formate hydrogenlyase subunit 3/multisubunit Na+/H+ antiporter MnhD subunit
MGYLLFGLSLFPIQAALTGTVLHIINNAVSKGLLFLTAGAVMRQTGIRDTRNMGGLAGQMQTTSTVTATAGLSIAGVPPFACFFSEVLIFLGAFQMVAVDNFYLIPTILMLVATMLSLAYILRYIGRVLFGAPKMEKVDDVPFSMKFAMIILAVFIVVLGVFPAIFMQVISTAFP